MDGLAESGPRGPLSGHSWYFVPTFLGLSDYILMSLAGHMKNYIAPQDRKHTSWILEITTVSGSFLSCGGTDAQVRPEMWNVL